MLPLLWEEHPDIRLTVIGADLGDAARGARGPRIRMSATSKTPCRGSRGPGVHVNPMRFGSGVKLKFLDSLAAGLPFVTTAVGAEGLPLGERRRALVAEDPAGLVRRILRLYEDQRSGSACRRTCSRSRARLRPGQLPAHADRGDVVRRHRSAGRGGPRMSRFRLRRSQQPEAAGQYEWSELKERKRRLSEEFVRTSGERLASPVDPMPGHLDAAFVDWIRHQAEAEPYWFQKVELFPGYYSPGWSDPIQRKLPYFGLPEDLSGMRVLDIGCAEGFFSFEAERRGAREVIGIDSFPDSIRRFNIVKAARQSNATAFLMNVYDLEPKRLGTFDLVLFYGVLYHLKHPQLALERIRSVCAGTLLFQTSRSKTRPAGRAPRPLLPPRNVSGGEGEHYDPTVFWLFNEMCCVGMLDHVGFTDLEMVSHNPHPFVMRARSPEVSPGKPPDQTESPWC